MIINEYQYVKNILETKEKPKEISIKKLILYIGKFYYEDHKKDKLNTFKQFIFKELSYFDLDSSYYRESIYDKFVSSICTKLKKGKISHILNNPMEVCLTKEELEIIDKASTEKHKKLLFTMYVLAKTRENSNGWVNYSIKEIFQCANINIKRDEKMYMLNDLKSWGLINVLKSYERIGLKVEYKEVSDNNPYTFVVTDFNNIGNQYIVSIRNGWRMCEHCGRLTKIRANANKYCNKCALIIEKKNANLRKQKERIKCHENENDVLVE